jgi:hypothetical protein
MKGAAATTAPFGHLCFGAGDVALVWKLMGGATRAERDDKGRRVVDLDDHRLPAPRVVVRDSAALLATEHGHTMSLLAPRGVPR